MVLMKFVINIFLFFTPQIWKQVVKTRRNGCNDHCERFLFSGLAKLNQLQNGRQMATVCKIIFFLFANAYRLTDYRVIVTSSRGNFVFTISVIFLFIYFFLIVVLITLYSIFVYECTHNFYIDIKKISFTYYIITYIYDKNDYYL